MSELKKLALDLARGTVATEFTNGKDADAVLREAFKKELGVDKIDAKIYRRFKPQIFEIIEETITPILVDRIEEEFAGFAEIRNIAYGDSIVFNVPNQELFEVAVIADGANSLRRQRIDHGEFTVDTQTQGVKIYEEFSRFLAGRINWGDMVNRVVRSYQRDLAQRVYNAIFGAFDSLSTEYKYTGSYVEDEVVNIAQHVEAANGRAIIMGTKAALSKLKPTYIGDADKSAYNRMGYHAVFNGFEVREIAQFHKPGTNEFAVTNNDILIVPAADSELVKVVLEGDAWIHESQNTEGDLSLEYTYIMKSGVAFLPANKFGIVRLV